MFELPKECYVNKFLPKKIFYEKVGVSSGVKEEFVNLVDRITWLYKLSPDTIGISKTDSIEEIQIFQIDVKEKRIPLSVIKTITKGVQYKILFLIKYNDNFCYSIKADEIFSSEWNDNINFEFNAINLEIVYENIVKSIIKVENTNGQFEEILSNVNLRNELQSKASKLEQKIKTEKQFNKKVELNHQLQQIKKKLGEMNEN